MGVSKIDVIAAIAKHINAITRDESLASLVRIAIEEQLERQPTPKDYYYLTDLTNPAPAFFSLQNPDVRRPPELGRKLALGVKLHANATAWFRSLSGFMIDEGTVDGAWVGVPGVRGRIDYRIENSLMEFKTKDDPPRTPDDIVGTYPQDLEQLVFYSAIHPEKPADNYLVFMRNTDPYELKAFSVITRNFGAIRSIVKRRIHLLDAAYKTGDPSKLPRCRHYDKGCHLQNACRCGQLETYDMSRIIRSISIAPCPELAGKIEDSRKQCGLLNSLALSTRDVIAPRKHFMRAVTGQQSYHRDPRRDEYDACLWITLRNLKKQQAIGLTSVESQKIRERQSEQRIHIGFRWIKIKVSGRKEDQVVPYLAKVSFQRDITYTASPSAYYVAELGIVCSVFGLNKGLIFVVYPDLHKLVRVFQVTFNDVNGILALATAIIEKVEKSEGSKDLLLLPPCPAFMSDGGNCPLFKECHQKTGLGCTG